MTFNSNYEWQKQHIPCAAKILAEHLRPRIFASTVEQDLKEATDLVVKTPYHSVALRLRRPSYEKNIDVTIRYKMASGMPTEWEKIISGWCDVSFYGHVNLAGEIHKWVLYDLHKFRNLITRYGEKNFIDKYIFEGSEFGAIYSNDSLLDSKFIALQIIALDILEPNLIIAHNGYDRTPLQAGFSW